MNGNKGDCQISILCPNCGVSGSLGSTSASALAASQFSVLAVLSFPGKTDRDVGCSRGSSSQQKWHWSQDQKHQFSEAFTVLQGEGLQAPQPKQVMRKMIDLNMNMNGLTLRRVQSYHQKYTDRDKRTKER